MNTNLKASKNFFQKFQHLIDFSSKDINPNCQFILSVGTFNRYLQLSSHQELLDISEKYGKNNCFCESRLNSTRVNLFFDYDCKEQPVSLSDARDTLNALKTNIQQFLPQLQIQFYVKQSVEPAPPDSPKSFDPSGTDSDSVSTVPQEFINSMHIICHLTTPDGHNIYFDYSNGCSQVKHFVSKIRLQKPFDDKSAYSGHLLRLLYSNKFDKAGQHLTGRIFQCSPYSNLTDPLKSLSSYCPTEKYMFLTDYLNKHFILQYVKGHQYAKNYLFKDIHQRPNESHLSLTLTEQHTPVCSHQSNNAVCMLYHQTDNPNVIIKCQDAECRKFFQTFLRYDDNLHRCQIFATSDNSSDKQSSDQNSSNTRSNRASSSGSNSPNSKKRQQKQDPDFERIQQFVANLSSFLPQETAYTLLKVLSIQPNSATLLGQPPQNNERLALVLGTNNQHFQCQDNQLTYQFNGQQNVVQLWSEMVKILRNIEKKYSEKQLEKQQIVYNFGQYIENQINNYNSPANDKDDTVYDDAFDSIEFPSETHREHFINIINDDFQFITELYNLEFPDQFIYVYDESDKGCAMYFDNYNRKLKTTTDGGYWNMQGGIRVAKQRIRDYVVKFFDSIMKQLNEPKDPRRKLVQIKLRSVRNVLKNNIELDQYLYETYFHKDIQFNNFPQFLHFKNGTFDLEQRKFIKTIPDMYNTFQIDYDYDQSAPYSDIRSQLSQIMMIDEFEWFLKQLSNCLNPKKVIEEKQIVILTGFGNNGKTILFNLINHTFGLKAYSASGRSQMIQGQNATSSAATPDQVKLLYKRFCYVAELDKTLPFNQQAVKILTGGEEIQARDLYKSLITFQPSAGIFISCNQIPYIDTSDGGFLNRLKIIDLKYQFEEHPSHRFQKPINRDLTHQVKTTEWKQGFMNLLILYYYKNRFNLPQSIKNSINIRINLSQNPLHLWAQDNIQYQQDSFFLSEDANSKYFDDTNNKIKIKTFNNQINDFFQQQIHKYNDVVFKKKIDKVFNGTRFQGSGFFNCILKQSDIPDSLSE